MAGVGGKRPGAGRKKGSKSQATLERNAFSRRSGNGSWRTPIASSKLSLARGQQFLYKIEKELQIGPKGGKKYVNSKPKLVTEEWEIRAYLDGLVEDGDVEDENDPNATYYFITTKEPNNMAIDSMFNRAVIDGHRCGT